jgi:predicted O-methyltransferase YrrM
MSAESTLVTTEHFDYVREHTDPEDEFLVRLREAALAARMPAIWISFEQARLMQILLKLARAKEVVEVGTLGGYSAIAMARALPSDGRVRTIEISKKHAEFAKTWVGRSDVADKVEVHLGAGADVLPSFATGSADAAFLDADKVSYPLYLEHALRIVKRGGLIMVDNAFAFGQLFDEHPSDRDVPAVRAFNERMARCDQLERVIVPIGDGLWVGYVR